MELADVLHPVSSLCKCSCCVSWLNSLLDSRGWLPWCLGPGEVLRALLVLVLLFSVIVFGPNVLQLVLRMFVVQVPVSLIALSQQPRVPDVAALAVGIIVEVAAALGEGVLVLVLPEFAPCAACGRAQAGNSPVRRRDTCTRRVSCNCAALATTNHFGGAF